MGITSRDLRVLGQIEAKRRAPPSAKAIAAAKDIACVPPPSLRGASTCSPH